MRDTYSLYEAKAKLSAIIRQVREGHPVVVTLRGEPVAEIRPVTSTGSGIGSRVRQLVERSVIVRPPVTDTASVRTVKRPGALKRFLDDRE
ncbi:MAG: type II toxin-antitoxin system Phd/YefM family antitoxin [Gemmatimonadaceae bacterium]